MAFYSQRIIVSRPCWTWNNALSQQQPYNKLAKDATLDAFPFRDHLQSERRGGCDLPSNGGNLLGCCPVAHRNAIRSNKSGDGSQPRARRALGGEAKRGTHSEPKAVRLKPILTAVSAETESRVGAGIRFFFFYRHDMEIFKFLGATVPPSSIRSATSAG